MNITISMSAEEVEVIARLFVPKQAAPDQATAPAEDAAKPQKPAKPVGKPTFATLTPGNVDWLVEIDGIPVHWMLDYPVGGFPVARGGEIVWQGECYRVSHLYGTSLKVTSLDADRYAVQAYGQQGNGAVK